jgi:hypothetical protein
VFGTPPSTLQLLLLLLMLLLPPCSTRLDTTGGRHLKMQLDPGISAPHWCCPLHSMAFSPECGHTQSNISVQYCALPASQLGNKFTPTSWMAVPPWLIPWVCGSQPAAMI